MHWNKQKDLKVMLEPIRLCTILPGPNCIGKPYQANSRFVSINEAYLCLGKNHDKSTQLKRNSYWIWSIEGWFTGHHLLKVLYFTPLLKFNFENSYPCNVVCGNIHSAGAGDSLQDTMSESIIPPCYVIWWSIQIHIGQTRPLTTQNTSGILITK